MNLPNKLSCFRMILVPLIVLVWIFPYANFNIKMVEFTFGMVTLSLKNIIVLVLFAIASFTDYLDGQIARKNNLITSFGKFIDPIADKLLVNTMMILFACYGMVPIVPVIVMIWRDTIVDGLRMSTASKGVVVAAGLLGKLKTVSQMLTIILVLLNNLPFELWRFPMAEFLLWFSCLVSVVSGISYFNQMKEYILETM
ncbi:MAG: CDP-diacylglycerol--glycerol-3-phosphate 3-phosphatidyltransferase [Traorella sp.]